MATTYCAPFSPGVPIPLTSFNTFCWDGSGTTLAPADVPNIDKVAVQVSSTERAATVEDLCLVEIAFR